jgi:pimeloyl-ACP methyl ester carboxylesterase
VAHRNEPFHFGPDESLYGVLTRPERPRSHVAVLVCAPVGQEKVRAQFVLQNLGRRLAHEGLPMLHFDHHGCGDSLGEAREMPCARWQCDIRDALAALVDRTGATRVVAVGARLGATLLFNAGISTKIAGMVLWDPILSGADHVSRASVMHRRQLEANEYSPGPLRALFQRRKPRPSRTELLGAVFSTEALGELRALSIARGARSEVPVRWLASSPESRDARAIERVRGADPWRVGALDVAYAWEDPRRLEDVLPDVGISAALATMIVEALE